MLGPDATILSVLGTLENKEQYVRRVVERMRECTKMGGSPIVKIGKRGKGKNPCYWIEYSVGTEIKTFGTFFCSKEFSNDFDQKYWSDAAMSLFQLESLLADIEAGKA